MRGAIRTWEGGGGAVRPERVCSKTGLKAEVTRKARVASKLKNNEGIEATEEEGREGSRTEAYKPDSNNRHAVSRGH